MGALPYLGGAVTVIKYPVDMVCPEWGLRPHAFRLDGGQVSHCNVAVASAKCTVWPGVCVFVNVLLGASDRVSFFCVDTSFH